MPTFPVLGLVAYEQVRKRLFPHKAKLSSVHPPAQLKGTELTVAIDGVWRQKFQFPPFQVLGEKALSPPVSWFFPPKFDLGVLQESFLDHHGGRFWQRFRSCVVHLLEPLDNVRSGGIWPQQACEGENVNISTGHDSSRAENPSTSHPAFFWETPLVHGTPFIF